MRTLKDILASGSASIEALLKEAFEAGKAEASSEMRARISAAIDIATLSGPLATTSALPPLEQPASPEGRASPGTVKPALLSLIKHAGSDGITTDELVDYTKFKPNSVRGTISTLHGEHAIRKVGDRWVSADQPPSEREAINDLIS